MYFCFDIVERDGVLLPWPQNRAIQKTQSTRHCIDLEIIPEGLKVRDDDGNVSQITLFHGWENIPLYRFDEKLYNDGKFPFVEYNAAQNTAMREHFRKRLINEDIESRISVESEIGKLRVAVKKLIEIVEGLGVDTSAVDEISEFRKHNRFIEDEISKFMRDEVTDEIEITTDGDIRLKKDIDNI